MAEHKCQSHEEWLASNHYFCSCGHVEWAHSTRTNGACSHCNCQRYNGEPRPLTEYEKGLTNGRADGNPSA